MEDGIVIKEIFYILSASSFALGACIASFLNVVIWRVPRGESIVFPPSHCPKCGKSIPWWMNVPILSWLSLRGRCAFCKTAISPRYIIVETLGGILFLGAFLHLFAGEAKAASLAAESSFGFALPVLYLVVLWIWIALMIAGSFIDFDHKLLPDFTTVGGMVLGVAFWGVAGLSSKAYGFADFGKYIPLLFSISGLSFGFALMWLVRFLGTKAFKREAMGLGDVYLMGAVGAMCGPVAVLVTLILSSVIGSVAGLSLVALSKTKFGRFIEIPYGPYICAGCLAWIFHGPELVAWYCRLLAP